MRTLVRNRTYCLVLLLSGMYGGVAQPTVIQLGPTINDEIISPDQYTVFLTHQDQDTVIYTPKTVLHLSKVNNNLNIENTGIAHWVYIKVSKNDSTRWFLEFLDAHTNSLEVFHYYKGSLVKRWPRMGMNYRFTEKNYRFKNFIFPIEPGYLGINEFLIRIHSDTKTSLIFKLRTDDNFISAAKNEYYFLGIFYGILFITIVTNFILFSFLRERTYLYYSLYLISCTLLFLSEDTLGFEYLWPTFPTINKWITTYSPVLLLFSFYFYANRFLRIGNYFPKAKRYIFWIITICSVYLVVSTLITRQPADYRFYILPFVALYGAGISLWRKGVRVARYFVVAHSFVIIGITFLIFRKAGINTLSTPLTFFSLNIGFVIEIAILSFALGERMHEFKTLRIKSLEKLLQQLKSRQEAQRKLVMQLQENERLKDKLNNELEFEVQKRAKEIIVQNGIIAQQNEKLQSANEKLLEQADKISRLNEKLDLDNWALKSNIKSITEARVLFKNVDYAEFCKLYPDQDSCLKFLASKKWDSEYACRKCGNPVHCAGRTPYSRRCTKCRYEESPTAFTLLHKCKIPLNKAFYAIFLLFSSREKISSVGMSEKLNIRQSTCWTFMQKVNEAIRMNRHAWEKGWDSVLVEKNKGKSSINEINGVSQIEDDE